MKRGPGPKGLHLVLFCVLLLFDQFAKIYLSNFPEGSNVVTILPDFLTITTLVNPGIAFGMLSNYPALILWANIAITVCLVLYFVMLFKQNRLRFPFTLIIAGALSNLIDRFIYGGVFDYIDFNFFPTFNMADAYITVAIVLILKDAWFRKKRFQV
ncbi:MAG: signal peptidase II [Candidatus Omnitrophica bacterium]|nr:signal peptidase II [Candidatus Omnitrophota bacterium]